MNSESKEIIARAFCSPSTAELVKSLFISENINAPFDFLDFPCRLHKAKRSQTVNLEMLIQSPIGMYWDVIGYFEKGQNGHDLTGTVMFGYADALKRETNVIPEMNGRYHFCDDLRKNAVIALHNPLVYSTLMQNKTDAKFFLNDVHIDAFEALEPNTFNVWLDDRYGLSMAIGTVRLDLARIDSVTGVTDSEFDWCNDRELLTMLKNVGVNPYESKSELTNNRFD